MMYTSYYANLRRIPRAITPVAISNSRPKGFEDVFWLPELAPSWTDIRRYKESGDYSAFCLSYRKKLSGFSQKDILKKLPSGDIVFLCYEKDVSVCHRNIFASWLSEVTGEPVVEWADGK